MAEFKDLSSLPSSGSTSRPFVISYLLLYCSIIVLFLLLYQFVPVERWVGWTVLAVYLFVFFVLEPVYRQYIEQPELHILILEVYVFISYFIQFLFPSSPFAHLFYSIPIFSAALQFGLVGTMLTCFSAFLLELIRVSTVHPITYPDVGEILPDMLPLFILSLMLGYTVEQSNFFQRLLTAQLSNKNTFLNTLIESVPVGIFVTDETGKIVDSNQMARRMTGLSEPGSSSENIRDFLRVDSDGNSKGFEEDRFESIMETNESEIPVDLFIRELDFQDESEWLFVFSDLRPIRELQEKAERRRRLVALGEMGAGLAHEIRNPLGSLSGFVSILEQRITNITDDEKLRTPVKKIKQSYNRIDDLVTQFVEYAKDPVRRTESFSVRTELKEFCESFSIPEQIEFSGEFNLEDDVVLRGDPKRFEIVIKNLLRNARDAIDGTGKIALRLFKESSAVVIQISDTGHGIESDRVDKIFDPFVSFKDKGLGLGLSLAYRIVTQEYGGEIEIDSDASEGTLVTIRMPVEANGKDQDLSTLE